MKFLNYFIDNLDMVWERLLEHLQLTATTVGLAIFIGVTLGILISYLKGLKKPVIGIANIVQALPSIAMLGLLVPLLGIGAPPATFMVVTYSLLPIIKNTSTGLDNINKEMLEAARGIGMTRLQVLLRVQLPLALPMIMSGVRIATVTAVGFVTLAAFIGVGGLGDIIYRGIRTTNNNLMLLGTIPACLLALLADLLMAGIEKLVTPACFRSESKKTKKRKTEENMKKIISIILVATLLLALPLFAMSGCAKSEKIVIVSKDFTEQDVVGNMMQIYLSENTDYEFDYKSGMSSDIVFNSLKSGDGDILIDYTGTVYANYLQHAELKSADEVFEISKKEIKEKYDLEMLNSMGFNNTYTLSVTKETAEKYNLKTFSDLAKVSDQLVFGGGFEILERPDGLPGLKTRYGMTFKSEKGLDGSLKYQAISQNETQVCDAFATDGLLKKFELVTLIDDLSFFPPYYAVPIVRAEILEKYPEIKTLLLDLEDFFTDADWVELNYRVDVLEEKPDVVARDFLTKNSLI